MGNDKGIAKQPKEIKHKVKSKKGAKKMFYEVSAPLTSARINLYASSQEDLIDKTVILDLTKSLRGKSLELKLRIKLEKDKLVGKPESLTLVESYIRRVIRKGTDYCEDSFETECRDSMTRIKPFLIARKRVSRKVLRAIRDGAKKHLQAYLKTRNTEEIFSEIISNKLQKQLSLKLKKVYPLALCEIRVFEVLKDKTPLTKEASKEKSEEVQE